MHDAATHDGQHRGDSLDFLFGDFVLIEEIVVEDDKVAKLTDLDRAQDILFPAEPAIGSRIQPDGLLTRGLLASVDEFPGHVSTAHNVIDIEPWIDGPALRRVRPGTDVHLVTFVDEIIENESERRSR